MLETSPLRLRKFLTPVFIWPVFSSVSKIVSLAVTSSESNSAHVLQPSSTFSLFSSLSKSSGRFLTRIVAKTDYQDYLDNPEYKYFLGLRVFTDVLCETTPSLIYRLNFAVKLVFDTCVCGVCGCRVNVPVVSEPYPLAHDIGRFFRFFRFIIILLRLVGLNPIC